MSRYHPLDVRHPDNRDLLRRNFLLDPPRPRPARQTERKATTPAPQTAPQAAPIAPVSPWGGARRAAQSAAAQVRAQTQAQARTRAASDTGQQRRNGSVGRWAVLAIIGYWLIWGGGREVLTQFPMIQSLLTSIEGFLSGL